jgi:FkbM family methyltransferase
LLSFLRNNYKDQKNIIDIGANIGNHSLFFSKFMSNKVYSFEPYGQNIELFKQNLSNRNCTLYENALSDKNGKMVLYNCEQNNFGGFSLHKQEKSFEIKESRPFGTLCRVMQKQS